MNRKTILRKACLAAFAFGALSLSAAGVHVHDHAIADSTAHRFMTQYFGYKPTTSGSNDYDNVVGNVVTTGPTLVTQQGEAILVEVNPYWRGVYKYPTVNDKADATNSYKYKNVGASLWEEVKYGVKDVHKLPEPTATPDGYMFSYTGKLGRFYIARRRADFYNSYWDNTDKSYYRLLGRWYEEWSFLPAGNSDLGWADFAGLDHYSEFASGAVWYAPHDCQNSLDKNHFASFIADGEEGTDEGHEVTLLFYISKHWDTAASVKGQSAGTSKWRPFICLLSTTQNDPSADKVSGTTNQYDVTLNFASSVNKASTAIASDNETMWNNTKGGVKERFKIYRDGVLIAEVPADSLTKDSSGNYVWKDTNGGNHFSTTEEYGEDHKYEIVSELYEVDKDGKKVSDTPISTTKSNDKNAHIPGNEAFKLTIDGKTRCEYVPSTTFEGGKNNYTHVIDITTVDTNIKVKTGDVIELVQIIDGVETSVKKQTITSDLNDKRITSSSILGSDAWKTVTKTFTLNGGQTQGVYYKLKFTRADASSSPNEYHSNLIYLNSYRADISAVQAHRQGHPSGFVAPTDEVYHNEVSFTPSTDGAIYQYAILCNGDGAHREYFNEADYTRGQEFTKVELRNDVFANEGESGNKQDVKMFYTVVAYESNSDGTYNTYGSKDIQLTYNGDPTELVYYAGSDSPTQSTTGNTWNSWEGVVYLQLNHDESTEASDIDPDLIKSVKTYGVFKQGEDEVEKEFCSFEKDEFDTEGLQIVNYKKINLETEPGYETMWKSVKDLYDAGYDMQSAEVKAQWKVISQDLWKANMPTKMYTEVTYEVAAAQHTPETPVVPEEEVQMNLPYRAASSNIYKKYSNWAPVSEPDYDHPITGIDDVKVSEEVKVYPNPSSDYFNVVGVDGELCLYNLAGSLVKKAYANGSATINVSDLNKGVYMLKAGEIVKKVIVK